MQRRDFLRRSGAAVGFGAILGGSRLLAATTEKAPPPPLPLVTNKIGPLAPVRANIDRMIRVSVCLRPFRSQGPRLEGERIGEKVVIHNYGHGGSGWSLAWGSAAIAVREALATGEKNYAVIGCGAMGLTTALLLQQSGVNVTIYAKDRPNEARSAYATGVWSPDSRICSEEGATPAFAALWEKMCRESFRKYQTLLGVAGTPVEWRDRYSVSSIPFEELKKKREAEEGPYKFGKFGDLVKNLTPGAEELAPGTHPFGVPYVRRATSMVFNIASFQRILMQDFLAEGGRMVRKEFNTAADFATLPEKTIVHATGYGARALLGDESVIPVRGQLALLIPQPEVNYSLSGEDVSMVSRSDGIVVQTSKPTDFNNTDELPNRADSEAGVLALAKIMAPLWRAI